MKILRAIVYALFIIQFGIIIGFWWPASGSLMKNGGADLIIGIARLSGLFLAYCVLLQFLMRGRITFLEKIIGYEILNTLHKKNGHVMFVLLLAHPILITIAYSMYGKTTFINQFLTLLTDYDGVLNAFIGFVIFFIVIGLSIYIVRKRLRYELWYFVHVFTYAAVVFAWGHQLALGTDFVNLWFTYYWYGLYIFTLVCMVYWRGLKYMYKNYKHRFFVMNITKETADTFSIHISGQHMPSFQFEPGQFAMFRFFAKNTWWESHPFSFSDVANNRSIRITIKKLGDFTSRIDQLPKKTPLLLDGPHGIFTLKAAEHDDILCIAGGVGITPIRPLIEEAAKNGKKVVLIYGNKTADDIIFKKELDELTKTYKFPIHHVISRDPNYKGLKGRVDVTLIQKLVRNLDKYDIFICGPAGMPDALHNDLVKAGVSSGRVHFERFAF